MKISVDFREIILAVAKILNKEKENKCEWAVQIVGCLNGGIEKNTI
jgi:hypothetical protein